MKAIFHVTERSGYDGTNTYAELVDLQDNQGESQPNHPLWDTVNAGEAGVNAEDYKVFLYTDNPTVYGLPPQTVTVFGQELSPLDFQTGVRVKGSREVQLFELELS